MARKRNNVQPAKIFAKLHTASDTITRGCGSVRHQQQDLRR